MGFFQVMSKSIDLWLIGVVILLVILSCLMIFSTVYKSHAGFSVPFHSKQIAFGLAGFVIMIMLMSINYRLLEELAWPIYIISIVLLLIVLILGRTIHGAMSWFSVAGFTLQPSEFAKVALVIVLSRYINRLSSKDGLSYFSGLIIPILLALLPMGLIILQPDMGSTFIFFPLLMGILFLGNIRISYLIAFMSFSGLVMGIPLFMTYAGQKQIHHTPIAIFFFNIFGSFTNTLIFVIAIVGLIFLIYYILHELRFGVSIMSFIVAAIISAVGIFASFPACMVLRNYQRQRLIAFINPNIDPLGTGYHIIQSQVAIGSGGFFGKGFLHGTQGQLGFLPVQHTDFIFSVFAEELGLLGAIILFLAFLILLYRGVRITGTASNYFGKLLAGGIVWLFAIQIIINLGVTMGLMPVMGVALPFMSYGGSALVSSMAACGILLSIYSHRYMN